MFEKFQKKSFLNGLLYAAIILCFLVIVTVLYWIIVDDNFNPPSDLFPQEYTTVVPQGGSFKARFQSVRFRECYLTTVRSFRNERTGHSYVATRDSRLTIDTSGEDRTVEVPLPTDLEPGLYSYDSYLRYYCNPANNLFGPIVLDPPRMFFYIVEEGEPEEWSPFSEEAQQEYARRRTSTSMTPAPTRVTSTSGAEYQVVRLTPHQN